MFKYKMIIKNLFEEFVSAWFSNSINGVEENEPTNFLK